MMTQEELTQHIRRKLQEGYTEQDLRIELSAQGYSETEISNALLLASRPERPANLPLMIIISLLFIALGIWRINGGSTIWGSVLLGWGIVTLVIRVLPLMRR